MVRGRDRARARLVEAVQSLDGLAFMLDRGMAPIPRAAEIWLRYLICAFHMGSAVDVRRCSGMPVRAA
jgi:hypothetical protein